MSSQSPLPPDDRDSPRPPSDSDEIDFERTLREAEQSLSILKARYAQIQTDHQRQQNLQERQAQIRRELRQTRAKTIRTELKTELKRIQQQLEELEVALESQLFSWSGLKEVFWQAVRFGGLGIILGWMLRSWVG
ncbi:MAG: DUF2968 domain-containing protein [Cyanobacteria bacterium CRU_2_1]|nr:DUF2968 domain-containing protein [Cyanobacteria bacterium RU_5_0]NJR59800.1 DUF2968 domain-containing protein [Cyanobacteria bacterium CRU_2_1]